MYNRKKLKLQNETETAMKKFLLIFAVAAALSANAYAAEFRYKGTLGGGHDKQAFGQRNCVGGR